MWRKAHQSILSRMNLLYCCCQIQEKRNNVSYMYLKLVYCMSHRKHPQQITTDINCLVWYKYEYIYYNNIPLKTWYTEIKYKICAKLSNSQKNKISTHLTSCTASINMYSSVAFSKVMLNHYCCMFWRNKFVKTQEINNFSRDLKRFDIRFDTSQ